MTVKSAVMYILPPFFRQYATRIEASPLGYRLARGAFWSLSGALISKSLGLLSSIIAARILGKTGFGELGILQSTVWTFGAFAGFGMNITTTKYVAEFKNKDPDKTVKIIMLSGLVSAVTGGIMALLLVLFANWIAVYILAAPHLAGLIKITSILLFLNALNSSQSGALAGFEAFKNIAQLNLIAGLSNFPLILGGLYLGGLRGAVYGLLISGSINLILNHLYLRKKIHNLSFLHNFNSIWQEKHILWKFSFPAMLASSMMGPVNWVCSSIIVSQPDGYAEIGIFNAANQWRTVILFLPGILGQIALPMLSDLYKENNNKNYNKFLIINILFNFLITLIVIIIVDIFSSFIMESYGDGFKEGQIVLVILSAVAAISSILEIIGQSIASVGKMWSGFFLNLILAVVLILITWWLKYLGAKGFAIATILGYSLHLLITSFYVYFFIYRKKQS